MTPLQYGVASMSRNCTEGLRVYGTVLSPRPAPAEALRVAGSRRSRRSSLKERGLSMGSLARVLAVSGRWWHGELGVRGQGSDEVRPRSGRRALRPGAVLDDDVGDGDSRLSWDSVWCLLLPSVGSGCAHQGRVARFLAGPVGAAGHPFAATSWRHDGVRGAWTAGSIRKRDHACGAWGS
jgi:hypothetical protein